MSRGSEPAESINRVVVVAMAEKGIDISDKRPEPWNDQELNAADVVVTMGCGDTCPVIPGTRYVDWVVDDPSGKALQNVRVIRDDIEVRVQGLLEEIPPQQHPPA